MNSEEALQVELRHDKAYVRDDRMCTCIHCGKIMRMYFRYVELEKNKLIRKHRDNFDRLYGKDYAYNICAVIFCQGCDVVWIDKYKNGCVEVLKEEKKIILRDDELTCIKFILETFECKNTSEGFDELVKEIEVRNESISCFLDDTWSVPPLGKDGFIKELDCLFLPGCSDINNIDIKKQFLNLCDMYEDKLSKTPRFLATWKPGYI